MDGWARIDKKSTAIVPVGTVRSLLRLAREAKERHAVVWGKGAYDKLDAALDAFDWGDE